MARSLVGQSDIELPLHVQYYFFVSLYNFIHSLEYIYERECFHISGHMKLRCCISLNTFHVPNPYPWDEFSAEEIKISRMELSLAGVEP